MVKNDGPCTTKCLNPGLSLFACFITCIHKLCIDMYFYRSVRDFRSVNVKFTLGHTDITKKKKTTNI